MVNAANYFLQADQNGNPAIPSDILANLLDGIALLGHATADLSTLRRNSCNKNAVNVVIYCENCSKTRI